MAARIPTRTNDDDRYFTDKYQAMPAEGYTKMFERLLDHPNLTVRTSVEYRQIVSAARRGQDFGALAKLYSDDSATRETGGDLGVRAPVGSPQAQAGKKPTLAPELDAAVMALEPGQVTEPIKIADALVILQLAERQASRYRTYDEAKPEMLQRLQTEILEKAKRKWLDELKSRTHLNVRL